MMVCSMLALNASALAQVYDPPGPPPPQSPLIAWTISLFLFLAVLVASFKSSKRSKTD